MWEAAVRHLSEADPALARVIHRVGECRFAPKEDHTYFEALARSIVFQQLSGLAANTIYGRFAALFAPNPPNPATLLALEDEPLRAAGLSRQKIGYLRDLAARCEDGTIRIDSLEALPDDEIIRELVQVRGVGRWTAQMFLIFRLGRPDVLPELDLGIRKAVQQVDALPDMPAPAAVLERGAPWSPYATIASWYLWRSLELR